MAILFKTTRELEMQIDQFLDAVNQGALVFRMGVTDYLKKDSENFAAHLQQMSKLETGADELRRLIENRLYTQTLIPEHRGDVLGLLESTDNVIDNCKETLSQFDVEMPFIPEELKADYLSLCDISVQCTDVLISAVRAFFKDVKAVQNFLHKVYFFEKEADRIGNGLKRKAFRMDLDLSLKFHLRYFALHIQNVSDCCEDVADRLAIYTIKRTV
jgi:predicted phosphate transport protein (TIGR00153 family)